MMMTFLVAITVLIIDFEFLGGQTNTNDEEIIIEEGNVEKVEVSYLAGVSLQGIVLLRSFDFEGEEIEGQPLPVDLLDDKKPSGGGVDGKVPLIIT